MSLSEYPLAAAGSAYARWAAARAGALGEALLRHEDWDRGLAVTALPAGAPIESVDDLGSLQMGAPPGFAAPSTDGFDWLIHVLAAEMHASAEMLVVYGAYDAGTIEAIGAGSFSLDGVVYLTLAGLTDDVAVRRVLQQADNRGIMLGAIGAAPSVSAQEDPRTFLDGFARTARLMFATAYDIDSYMVLKVGELVPRRAPAPGGGTP